MPVRRRLRKRGTGGRLSDVQRLHLRRGDSFGLGSAFPDDDAEREAWAAHRDAVLQEHIEQNPGSRPYAWWRHSSPQSRDEQIHETVQLLALSEIGAAELDALKVQWRHWERIARDREDEYAEWREWAGIPDSFRECEPDTDQADGSLT